ncbi:MAG: hypothetical protein Q8922_09215 [Bacteroidota bacterium]|nr:hypothetical protein [Bacteroidota bacterium]MDP4234213.1 hypothetical protein [Bacteroidota bacterium]MDP4244127.1 hypothetical protein [Bacteroidota bacterium]MDP4288102.1 hypothetical protein [Bacteroidota bacterium]
MMQIRTRAFVIRRSTVLSLLLLAGVIFGSQPASAQLFGVTGANHPELFWQEIETDHFVIVYHQGLDSIARIAAPIAEEVYRVVTTNLETEMSGKVRIYLSDNDEERNAFAFMDDYIFVWLRGILDDNLFSLRASGTSKWLRSVLSHEFTHIVIARATHTWLDVLAPEPKVPRWFNEGMARYMEPDGWTNDLDVPLRIAAVSSKLDLGSDDFLAGTLIYEGGQSLVRYIAWKYGDSSLARIIKHGTRGLVPYDFDEAVHGVTKHKLGEIMEEWHKSLNVYYNTEFGQKEDVEDIARKIPSGLAVVGAARLARDGKRIAILGKRTIEESTKLFILDKDTGSSAKLLTAESGIEPYLSWSPDGKQLLFSKIRFGDHGDLIYDLFTCSTESGDLTRISSNQRLEYPDFSPDGRTIVCAQFRRSGSDLALLDADGEHIRNLTHFDDDNIEVYSPHWSPDGKHIAFSIFRKNGMRDVASVDVASGAVAYLTNDSINDRYPVWMPSGDSIIFLSFRNGLPNLYVIDGRDGQSGRSGRQLTDAASNVLAWDVRQDSVLITSFASRNSVQMYWLTTSRTIRSAPLPPLATKYTAWRTVRWPLITRAPDSIPSTITVGPYEYNSLGHIHPLLILPLIGSDLTHTGDAGTQWGGFTLMSDEMQKHALQAYGLYGDVSKTFSYGVEYVNNQLLPSIIAGTSNSLDFCDVLSDVAYYEQSHRANVGLNLALHTPNSLTKLHNLFFGGQWMKLDPWNTIEFDSVPAAHRPISVQLLELTASYAFVSPLSELRLEAQHSDKKLASDLTRTRLRATIRQAFSGEDERSQIAFSGRIAADLGDELPQDFLGFYKYDNFEEGFNLTGIHTLDRLRGIRRYYYGNRLVMGSVEIVQQDKIFSGLVPILKALSPSLVEFFDIGSTWYADAPTNNPNVTITPLSKTEWLKTAGAELRSGPFEGGVGWELVKNSSADWFFRVTTGF